MIPFKHTLYAFKVNCHCYNGIQDPVSRNFCKPVYRARNIKQNYTKASETDTSKIPDNFQFKGNKSTDNFFDFVLMNCKEES